MYAPVWKAKIRKIAANFAKQSPGKLSGSKVTIGRKQKKERL